ncbi:MULTISPECIES: HtaA domain-containing protein [unclassified Pseudofrankia]|uniref:HtaA domain-containing protein n=1 Tax=unclassified Pseudofrankia TaxID=2994372 RepID=UPI0008D8F309|nr:MULTISPECIES: HtaA domain-containing protein [unclassified Pseudofrankia]MDT3446633.1 HtaA domain-containing protein [Pseudofrankia sp. BMG5.37]OHV58641.1 hypothetical protein BCD48_42485 [Pseudofrankia sp. BMG5.36]
MLLGPRADHEGLAIGGLAIPSTLRWDVKASFRSYVESAGGAVHVHEHATESAEGFCFPLRSAVSETDGGHLLQYSGSVHFRAHGGLLDVLVDTPWLHLTGPTARLSIRGTEATRTAGARLMLAEIEPGGPGLISGAASSRVVLTDQGAVLFDFRYPGGTELAPVSLIG